MMPFDSLLIQSFII